LRAEPLAGFRNRAPDNRVRLQTVLAPEILSHPKYNCEAPQLGSGGGAPSGVQGVRGAKPS